MFSRTTTIPIVRIDLKENKDSPVSEKSAMTFQDQIVSPKVKKVTESLKAQSSMIPPITVTNLAKSESEDKALIKNNNELAINSNQNVVL